MRAEKPDDGLQHSIGRKSIALMDPQHPAIQAQHHGAIGVGQDSVDIPQTEQAQSIGQQILKQKKLPRCPAVPLS